MNLIHRSMRRPISVVVALIALLLTSVLAVSRMPRDILPDLGVPTIMLVQPYGGMDAAQMEGYVTYFYEYNFLYVAGIEHTESKTIQGVTMIKLQFHPGTDMSRAMSEVINFANRALANMPSGITPPFVVRFDPGSEPVGKLVFNSETRKLSEVQDLANNRVRPLFSTLPGVAAPPPFGSSPRAVVINVDPKKLAYYNLSPYDVAERIAEANKVTASGNIRIGNLYPIVKVNTVVSDMKVLESVPLRLGSSPTVLLRDVATVEDGADIQTGYALVNGRRTVYIPVVKRADASTLAVVDEVRANLKRFAEVLPSDVTVSYEFDQSRAVRDAIHSLVGEGLLGALLTGLMVLVFLQSWRSALIVMANIPLAIAGALTALWLCGQTINIMTLGGLALAIGILIDETTITIENIHSHRALGKALSRAVLDATNEMIIPCLLTMLCVLAVFTPSFFMVGVAKALFQPLSLAVGFAVAGSFLLARTFVPVLAIWILPARETGRRVAFFAAIQHRYEKRLDYLLPRRAWFLGGYAVVTAAMLAFLVPHVGQEIFPRIDARGFLLRLRAPTGTYLELTEELAKQARDVILREAGSPNVESTNAFVGTVVGGSANNVVYLWTSGPHEAVLEVNLKKGNRLDVPALQERLRHLLAERMPEVAISFEPHGILNRVMSQGSPTPIEVAIAGPDLSTNREFAKEVRDALMTIPSLRDLQYGQVFDYPTVGVKVDRRLAGERGFSAERIGRTLIPATSSSRLILRNFWADPQSGYGRQVQIQVPEGRLNSLQSVGQVPIGINGGSVPLSRLARIETTTALGEIDRYNSQRIISLTANIAGEDLGHAARRIEAVLAPLEKARPRGVTLTLRGQVAPMHEIFDGLRLGLILAVVTIFLLLAANFQSPVLALVVVTAVPAVICGVGWMLLLTGTTLNIQSFIGSILAIGVSIANSILMVTFAERLRRETKDAETAARQGALTRLRPILMTSGAMIVGMIPMAVGHGESGQQSAPLGRAVIGGLWLSTITTLYILPLVYAATQKRRSTESVSLDPSDPQSAHHDVA